MAADAELMRRALAQGDTARRPDRAQPVGRRGRRARRRGRRRGRHAAPGRRPRRARGPPRRRRPGPWRHRLHHPRTLLARTAAPRRASARSVDAGVTPGRRGARGPRPRRRRQGIAQLRDHGLTVDVGIDADLAARALAPYLLHRRLGRAFTVVKTAMSLDGRIAARDGSSQWITGAASRADAHVLRADSQAVMVGAGTALADRPSLTVRDLKPPGHRASPLRVLLDATVGCPPRARCSTPTLAPTLVVTTRRRPTLRSRPGWRPAPRCSPCRPSTGGTGVDLDATLEMLAGLGVLQVLVEGGAATRPARWCEAGLADRIVTYVAPTMLGRDGRLAFDLDGPARSTTPAAGGWSTSPGSAPTSASTTSPARAERQAASWRTQSRSDVHRASSRSWAPSGRSPPTRAARASRSTRPSCSTDAEIGASIAVNGCCLTVVELHPTAGGRPTRSPRPSTAPRSARSPPATPVNLERPMRLSDRLGGHVVQGHVDGVGTLARPRTRCPTAPPA